MKNINILYAEYIVFISIVWCTFNENFSPLNLSTGIVLGHLLFKLSKRFLLEEKIGVGNHKKGSVTLYMIYLLWEVYKNAFDLMKIIVMGELDPVIVETKTKAVGKVGSVIANSITLTPKTATVNKTGDSITVVCAHQMTEEEILEDFEEKLLDTSPQFVEVGGR